MFRSANVVARKLMLDTSPRAAGVSGASETRWNIRPKARLARSLFCFPTNQYKTQDTSCSQKTAANTRGRLCLHLLQASERLVFDRLLSKRDSGALESSRGPGLPAPQVHMLLCELQEFHHFFSLRLLVIIAVHDSVLHQARPLLEATRRSEPNGFS